MIDRLADCTDHLAEILSRGVTSENDFVALATVGEEQRRLLALAEDPSDQARAVARDYERVLVELRAGPRTPVAADGLGEDVDAAFRDWGGVPGDLLDDVDQLLAVAAAAGRAGALDATQVLALAARASAHAGTLVGDHPDLADDAERRSLVLGPDPDYPGLYDYVEVLAAWSTARGFLRAAVRKRSSAQREALIRRAEVERRHVVVGSRFDLVGHAPPASLAAAGPTELDEDKDLVREGRLVFENDVLQVHAGEVASGSTGASVLGLRVALASDAPGDLTAADAVVVRTLDNVVVEPVARAKSWRDRWMACFDVDELLVLEITSHRLVIELPVVRKAR